MQKSVEEERSKKKGGILVIVDLVTSGEVLEYFLVLVFISFLTWRNL